MTSFVNTYYKDYETFAADIELTAWFNEATTAALAIDFPCQTGPNKKTCNRDTLIDILTHIGFQTGVAHHALNTGDLASSAGTLPFHPAALYAPLPTTKGVSDLLPFMPPLPNALFQVNLMGAFNRPQFEVQNRTLAWAYSAPEFLGRFQGKLDAAAKVYQDAMFAFSNVIRARKFGKDGLSQGMPFVWKNRKSLFMFPVSFPLLLRTSQLGEVITNKKQLTQELSLGS